MFLNNYIDIWNLTIWYCRYLCKRVNSYHIINYKITLQETVLRSKWPSLTACDFVIGRGFDSHSEQWIVFIFSLDKMRHWVPRRNIQCLKNWADIREKFLLLYYAKKPLRCCILFLFLYGDASLIFSKE